MINFILETLKSISRIT